MMPILRLFPFLALLHAMGASDFDPARLRTGGPITPSPMTAGGGEVLLELDVDASGNVTAVTTLRSTPPYTEQLRAAVRTWRFSPARELPEESTEWQSVDTKVLVAGVFRPPTTYDAPARGEVAEDVATASSDVPFPTSLATPAYPPLAAPGLSGSSLVEVELGDDGNIRATKVLRAEGAVSDVSKEAAAKWRFRPARRGGEAVPSVAYLVFGFSEPVASR